MANQVTFTKGRRGYHVADMVADMYLGQVQRHDTWRTTGKGNRTYWTATVGATRRQLLDSRGLLCTFSTRAAAAEALQRHWAEAGE